MSVRAFARLAVLLSSSAFAQLPTVTISTQPYVPLSGPGVQTISVANPSALTQRTTTFDATDEGYATLSLPFSFPYFGQNYNQVHIDVNGFLSIGATACTSWLSCTSVASFPSTAVPNGMIGGFWADYDMDGASAIRYQLSYGELIVEWSQMVPYFGTGSSTFQVRITPSGMFTIHHGPMTGFQGAVGYENAAGTLGANVMPGCTTACGSTQWVVGRYFQIGEPDEVDIGVTSVTVQDFVRYPDDNLEFTINATLRNFGRTGTDGGFEWAAYLSRDRVLDTTATDGGADILVATGTAPGLPAVFNGVTADGGQAIVDVTAAAATSVPPPTGEYYVLVFADSTDVVAEASEANNVGSTATAFVQGVDLVASAVSGPTAAVGGADAGVTYSFINRGTSAPDAGVPFRILLSNDNLLDSTDFPIANAVRTVSGGETVTGTVTFEMPANAPAGEFFYLLQVDPPVLGRPDGVIEEAVETNNWVASTGKVTISRSDLVMESVEFLDPVTNLPTTNARFGEAVRMRARFRNAGQATALNFRVGLVLSTDSSLSLLSDVTVDSVLVPSLAPSATSTEVIVNGTLPLNKTDGTPYASGSQYYVFGHVDVTSAVYETNEQNNSQVVGPLRITAPGPDLAVTSLTAPTAAGVGEILPVTRSLRNLGNRDAPAVVYRYYASANDIITVDDIALPIVEGGTTKPEGSVTLAANTSDTLTELVQLPGTMPAGTYYIGCIIDPTHTVATDLEPTNNALAASATTVAPPSLRIVNTQLPDAVIGRPYTYRLSAVGELGASTWSIDTSRGSAPGWLTIGAADGVLSGTPTGTSGAEVVGVTVAVENGGRQAVARLALRVLPTSSGLEVVTTALPAVVNSVNTQYDFLLGAAGGVLPYSWRVASGSLPTGLTLNASGQLSGAPRNTPNGSTPVTVEVRDAVGSRATRALTLRLIPAGAISFRTISIPDALVGQEYLQDIAVVNLDGSALARPLSWRVTGSVPGGLSVTPQAELITLAGRPTQAGTFSFTIGVEDANGRSDSLEFTMTVHGARYRVLMAGAPDVFRPGEAADITLSVSPQGTVTYRVVNGALPAGLTLDAAGTITGTVDEAALDGASSFVIEARDAAGISGVTPLTLRVERAPRVAGCSAAVADPSLWVFGLGALALLRRRRGR